MATARGCGGCWRGWSFMNCLAAGHCCCCCSTSTSTSTPQAAPPLVLLPDDQLPEITLEQLEAIIPIIEHEIDRLDPRTASSSSGQPPISESLSNMLADWEKRKQMCTSFINSVPKQLTHEVAGNGGSLFMSILTNVLSGAGGVQWLGVGFTFIAWSLDNISSTTQNRGDCIGILRRSLRLLRNTKQIWKATNIDNDDLRDSVERAFRCAIFCTSTLTDVWILRFLKAKTVKDAIAMFEDELERANIQNIEFMVRHNLQCKVERQITFKVSNDDIVGGQDVIQKAVTYLNTSCDDIMAISLHGMGGIGKSFLGLKIFTKFQKSKYRDCRVELQLVTKEGEFCDIQKQILEKVCKHATSKFSNPTDGRQNMEKELKQINDPIFLYVDNVLEHHYLLELLPKATFFPKGSRILITSRGDYIGRGFFELGITHYELVEVRKLQKQQAQKLLWEQFKGRGEHRDINNSEVESLEDKVLELCDGLPLALTVVGKYIAFENGLNKVEVWRQVVNGMQKAKPFGGGDNDELYSRIMFSIDNLHPDVKAAFLDIIFFEVCPRVLWPTWETIERLVSDNCLEVLCRRGLVRKSERTYILQIRSAEVHDVLKAIGKSMVDKDKHELRITGMNNFEELHNNALKRVVALDHVTVDAHLLTQMPKLRLLKDVDVRGECQAIQLRRLRVVFGLRCSTPRVFDWSECGSLKQVDWGQEDKGEAAPNVSNLEIFKHDKISMRLECLSLYEWRKLKDVQVLETLTCLKDLQLVCCREIESLPEGISRLTGLNFLDLRGCEKLEGLPPGISRLTDLNELDLSGCRKLKGLPQGISRLRCLEVLNLMCCVSVQSLPDELTSLTGLPLLSLRGCESLQSIPEGIGNLRAVTCFDELQQLKRLESIPEGAINLMSGLTELSLAECYRIKYLPEGITRLTDLKKLDLRWCTSLQSLPEGVLGLTGLSSLSLVRCQRLQALPEGIFASLSALIELDLMVCVALQALPEDLSCLTGLTELRLADCKSLKALPAKLGFMTRLRQLDLSRCESLQFLPDDMSKLTGLVHLVLNGCKSLQSIQGVTTLTALRILEVRNCTQLQLLPEGCIRLTSLRYIYLSGCTSLKSIPEASLGQLTGLEEKEKEAEQGKEEAAEEVNSLNLMNCESLKSLPQSIGSFTHLERLGLANCTSLESLPEGVTRLTNLAKLNLLGCKSLQCLPRLGLIGSLTGLMELSLTDCAMLNIQQPLLEEVSSNLTNLKVLQLSDCKDLQSLPQGITSLMSLEKLCLLNCRNFQLLPQGMANWKGLRSLVLSGCQSIQSLPEELTTMTALSVLDLSRCACLRSLPQGIFTSLGALEKLSMSGCGGLQLEESQGITRLTGLSTLHLSECEHLLFLLSEQQGLASLTCLKELYLSRCRSLQSLPDGVAALTSLCRIKLSGCASLQSLSTLPQGSTCLKSLHLGGCGNLDQPSVWERIISFKCLEYLNLSGWETMQALPEGIASLESLEVLDLSKCRSLQSLRPEITRLVQLDSLDLSGCTSLEPLPQEITIWIHGIYYYRPCLHESSPQ